MNIEQEKMIVESLPSLYPLQKFEEEAINALVSLPIDDDAISRKAAIELCDWYDNQSMREDLEKLRPVRFSTDTISRAKAIAALKNDMASLDHIIKGMSANDVRLDAYVSQRNQVNYDIYAIEQLPPAQPEPSQVAADIARIVENGQDMRVIGHGRIKGRWIPVGGALYQCDQCGVVSLKRKFCSECGADMREVMK